jgi:hypothetical protein
MADESLVQTYEAQLNAIVHGARRTSPDWDSFFAETSTGKHFENRIRDVFEETGFVPSRLQYEQVQKTLLEGRHLYEAEEAMNTGDIEEAEEKVTKKATKK